MLPQYVQTDLTKAPTPKLSDEDVLYLYPEESQVIATKKWGWLRPLFKVLNWIPEEPTPEPVSLDVSKRKRVRGLFDESEEQ